MRVQLSFINIAKVLGGPTAFEGGGGENWQPNLEGRIIFRQVGEANAPPKKWNPAVTHHIQRVLLPPLLHAILCGIVRCMHMCSTACLCLLRFCRATKNSSSERENKNAKLSWLMLALSSVWHFETIRSRRCFSSYPSASSVYRASTGVGYSAHLLFCTLKGWLHRDTSCSG